MPPYIPLKNVYYMLCYAWDKLNFIGFIDVEVMGGENPYDLYARMLVEGTKHVFKRGIDKSYDDKSEEGDTLRGKVLIGPSIKRNLFSYARAYCEYSALDIDTIHNQILKASIRRLLNRSDLQEEKIREQLAQVYREFNDVADIKITSETFTRTRLHRNNYFYDFLLGICRLIHDEVMPRGGAVSGYSALKLDEQKLDKLFEAFVRNFFKRELKGFKVQSEYIRWDAKARDYQSEAYLPIMKTDISLSTPLEKTVIEAKFYTNYISEAWGKKSLLSKHLYQLYAYLKNLENRGGENKNARGILLYAQSNMPLNLAYTIQNHEVVVRTIDLTQDWNNIRNDLRSLVAHA